MEKLKSMRRIIKKFIEKLKNGFVIIKKILKNLISLLQKMLFYYEKFLGTIFPPLKWWYNSRDFLLKYEQKEKEVFIKHMPKLYKLYETHPIFIILRIWSAIFYVLLVRGIVRDFLNIHFNIDAYIVLQILEYSILIIFWVFLTIKFILRIIYIKEIIYNSPFNWKHAVISGMKSIIYPAVSIGIFGAGINKIDDISLRYGNIPPFQHYSDSMSYYLNGCVTEPLGTQSLDKHKLFESKNSVVKYLREEQIKSIDKRHELMELYICEQKGKGIVRLK